MNIDDDIHKRIDDIVENKPSGWLKEALWRQANRDWLNYSLEIALQIVMALREQNKTKKWLDEQLNVKTSVVNKMVKVNKILR